MPAKIIFTEEFCQPENLYPFTLTRQIQDIRIGILTIREKWEKMLGLASFDRMEDDYKDLDRSIRLETIGENDTYFLIHGDSLPTLKLIKTRLKLRGGEFICVGVWGGVVFGFCEENVRDPDKVRGWEAITVHGDVKS